MPYPASVKPGWASPSDFIDGQLAKMRGVDATYGELSEQIIGQYEIEYRKYEKGLLRSDGQPGFNTPTGRIELWCDALARRRPAAVLPRTKVQRLVAT